MLSRSITFILILFFCIGKTSGQEISFKVEVTSDTIYQGNFFKVRYTVENTQGDFIAPELDDWILVGGPNTSSQFSMINGQVKQSASYEYVLQAPEEGNFIIPQASLNNNGEVLTTDPIPVTVVANPDGIQVTPNTYGFRQNISQEKNVKPMTREDSLKMKLRKLKSVKI